MLVLVGLILLFSSLLCDNATHDIIHSYSTSSSAVAKRPRDASYLSVVSFNSTKRKVESVIVSYVGYRFVTACSYMRCFVVFGVTLRLLVINISSSSPTINTAAYYQYQPNGGRRPPATLLTTPGMLQR